MTPPTSIDGTDISGATIDGQEVQEITVDGQTVFTNTAFDLFNRTGPKVDDGLRYEFITGGLSGERPSEFFNEDPQDIKFSNDGLTLIASGANFVNMYSVSEPFSCEGINRTVVGSTTGNSAFGIDFNNDGTRMYEAGTRRGEFIFQTDLSTPFDIRTRHNEQTFDFQNPTFGNFLTDVTLSNDGSRMFITDAFKNRVEQYNLSTPFDVTTASETKRHTTNLRDDNEPEGVQFSSSGKRMYVIGSVSSEIVQSSLPTPFDIGTVNVEGKFETIDSFGTSINFSPSGRRFYVTGGFQVFQSLIG